MINRVAYLLFLFLAVMSVMGLFTLIFSRITGGE
jgi:hypothetical protein